MKVRIIKHTTNHYFPIGTILDDVVQVSDMIFGYNEPTGGWRWWFLKEELEIIKEELKIKGKHGYILPLLNPELKSFVRILALNQNPELGYAISKEFYGIWNLPTCKDDSIEMKLIHFEAKLLKIIELAKINLIVYERIACLFPSSDLIISIIESTCEKRRITYRAYSTKEIKQFATGKSTCEKSAMIKVAQEKLGYQGENYNEVNALWILELAKSEYKLI